MGIAIQELLSQEYFKDFYVLAGAKGLHREIQGITVMEAPDAFHWTKGKELVLSSGYVIAKEPDCIEKAFREGSVQKSAGMMIKRERYLEKIPEEILELFDQYEVPLISMPFSAPWMEVMSQINTAVLNRTIRRLRINTSHMTFQMSNFSYKEQKIKRILQAMEAEMGFPAFLYDFVEEEAYYSSMNFQKIAKGFGLETEDFWEPSMPYTRHTLCDYMDMVRYRLVNQSHQEGPRISWIRVPISVNGSVQAYFAVMEAREFLDYYDEYSIRIAYLMLQGLYEQIVAAQNMGNIGFENFVLYALSATEDDTQKMMFQANVQGISMSTKYRYVLFRRADNQEELPNRRKEILEAYRKSSLIKYARIAMIGENVGILFFGRQRRRLGERSYPCTSGRIPEKSSEELSGDGTGIWLFTGCRFSWAYPSEHREMSESTEYGENDLSKPFCMGVFSAWCTCMAGYSGRRAYSYALDLQCTPER